MAALVLLATGCSGPSDPSGDAAASATASGTSEPTDPTTALRERCLSAVPADAELEALSFAGSTGGEIEAARIGPGANDRVAVLLPQVGGMCGWGRWAAAAAEESGLTSLLVNPCGYGESECAPEEDEDPLNEVAAALELAALAPRLPAGGLVMMAPSDGQRAFASARRLAAAAGVPFVPGRSGHGWELLVDPVEGTMTRLGRRLVELAEGAPEA